MGLVSTICWNMKKIFLLLVVSFVSNVVFAQSYRDLLTSDPEWNRQIQLMVQQYGVEKTRQMVKQYRAQQGQQNYGNQNYNNQNSERVIQGVYVYGNQLAVIRLRYFGGKITHISTSKDMMGREQWQQIYPDNPHPTMSIQDGQLAREYKYKISAGGTVIYFNL